MTQFNLKYGNEIKTIDADIYSRQDNICFRTKIFGVPKEISFGYDEASKLINELCKAHNTAFNSEHEILTRLQNLHAEAEKKG